MSDNPETTVANEETAPAVEESTSGVEQPAAEVKKAVPAARVYAPVERQPSVESQEPVAEAEEPAPAAGEPSVEAQQPVAAAEEAAPAAEEPAADATDESVDAASAQKRNVRRLAVGEEVKGVVKRTTEFGAFVDIGVGRDGLIHISELSVQRVGKVSDVLKQGQEITGWIKKLDRDRNRISLTLIPPGTKTIRDLEKDDLVDGVVTRLVPYGAFVDIGVGRDALLHVREMAEGYVKSPEDVVKVGEQIEAKILEVSRRRGRIDLTIKGLRPEPEPVVRQQQQPEPEAVAESEEEDVHDPFADVEVLSPMELAFQRAMGGNEGQGDVVSKKYSKRARKQQLRAIQDEIIHRTLSGNKK